MISRDEFTRIIFNLKQAKKAEEYAEADLAKAMRLVSEAKEALKKAKATKKAAQKEYDNA